MHLDSRGGSFRDPSAFFNEEESLAYTKKSSTLKSNPLKMSKQPTFAKKDSLTSLSYEENLKKCKIGDESFLGMIKEIKEVNGKGCFIIEFKSQDSFNTMRERHHSNQRDPFKTPTLGVGMKNPPLEPKFRNLNTLEIPKSAENPALRISFTEKNMDHPTGPERSPGTMGKVGLLNKRLSKKDFFRAITPSFNNVEDKPEYDDAPFRSNSKKGNCSILTEHFSKEYESDAAQHSAFKSLDYLPKTAFEKEDEKNTATDESVKAFTQVNKSKSSENITSNSNPLPHNLELICSSPNSKALIGNIGDLNRNAKYLELQRMGPRERGKSTNELSQFHPKVKRQTSVRELKERKLTFMKKKISKLNLKQNLKNVMTMVDQPTPIMKNKQSDPNLSALMSPASPLTTQSWKSNEGSSEQRGASKPSIVKQVERAIQQALNPILSPSTSSKTNIKTINNNFFFNHLIDKSKNSLISLKNYL